MIHSVLDETIQEALLRAAARNNADWCEAMCRAHGLRGEFRSDAWTSPARTPPYYPDAVTLTEHADPDDLLARIDTGSGGSSVKDSFAVLDLTDRGFTPLFDAQWIARPADPPAVAPHWQRIRTAGQLAAWEIGWDGGTDGLFLPPLLEDPSVLVLAAPDLGAGAVLSLGAGVVGVSNLFTADEAVDPARAWHDCLAAASAHCPGLPVVGYESGEDLVAAERAGFTSLGPLRIWLATN
ncbi:hypothetical protein ABIA32_004703 [Streptacidiphilus sp. MAP12-20]|uniref:hypothetical protein n=1 Tax=Streptacidiphilus sp. MAP12-20 TaxID=3156299 RepID=UPI003515A1C2